MRKFGHKFKIGTVVTTNKTSAPILEIQKTSAKVDNVQYEQFGDMVPFGDPSWYQGYYSNYYNETHVALRSFMREWVEEHIEPYVDEWDEAGKITDDTLFTKFAQFGFLCALTGLHHPPKEYKQYPLNDLVPYDKFDAFHEVIIVDEICRSGSGGVVWYLTGGFTIGIPPILKYTQPQVRNRVIPDILAGKKRICLSITEPQAGSDVANLTTTAEKTPDGKYYIVNGTKKWITNSIWADYFTCAVRTGGPGMGGVSVLLIEKSFPGVNVRKMETQGMRTSGSGFVTFEDVKVPVENLVGKENQGFKTIVTNFNHERIGIIVQAVRFSRVCYEEAMKYAHKRKTFGQYLIEHGVIRNKLAVMASRIEAAQAWMDNLIYQGNCMDEKEAMMRLGGPIAGCKAFATLTMELCAREASQIFGGLSYSRGGQAAKVERLYREVRAYAIPGGSEEIMLDLSIRQSDRVHKLLGSKM